MSKPIKVLGISGSLRAKSTNTALLQYAQTHAPAGIELTIANIKELPFYNADLSAKPAAVQAFLTQLAEAEALVLACPEYNYSIAPALKNALDWASREPNNALLSGKPVAIMGSAGGMGSSRAQYHLRQVCVFLNLHPLNKPEIFCNAFANTFDQNGVLTDERIQGMIVEQLVTLDAWVKQLRK
ncbi:MAG TPA: NADPH-dependent FMN reductase [Thiolinea sp.]|nr:NADPH-dependent FMN reductase [Thiolinea sp.]